MRLLGQWTLGECEVGAWTLEQLADVCVRVWQTYMLTRRF
jgi:hypothetical protein